MTKGATHLASALHLLELPEHRGSHNSDPLHSSAPMSTRRPWSRASPSRSQSPRCSAFHLLFLLFLLGMMVYLLQGLGDRLAWSCRKSSVTPRYILHGGQAVERLHYPGQRLRIAKGMTTDLAGIHPSPFGVVVRSRSAQARSSAVCCRKCRLSPGSLHPAWWSGCPRQGRSPPA